MTVCGTYQIKRTPDKSVPHTRTILRPSTSDQHNTVLLNIVSLTGNIRRNDRSTAKLHSRRLALSGVGLLGSHDTDTETDALELRTVLS